MAPTTAALLSTGLTLPYALIQRRSARSPTCSARTRLIALSMLPTSEWRRASAAWQPNGDLFGWRGLSFLTTAAVALVAFALATPGFPRTSALHMLWPVEFAQFRMFGFGVRLLHGFVQSM